MSPHEDSNSAPIALGPATPVLRVGDLSASVDHYVGVLGFRLDWRDDVNGPFASVSRDHCRLFLCVGDQGHAGSWVWVGVHDADALHQELAARGARVRQPPTNYPWGFRELHVEDPDGNVLRLASESRPGEPIGDWIDMHGARWLRGQDGRWVRAG